METFGQRLIQSITQTELKLCLTHLATKMSSYLVRVETYRRAHMPFDAQVGVSQKFGVTNELLWNEKIWCKNWELLQFRDYGQIMRERKTMGRVS